MPALTLKDIPPELHESMKVSAEEKRQSLTAYAISVLEDREADQIRRRRMRENRDRLETFVASMPKLPAPEELIQEDQER